MTFYLPLKMSHNFRNLKCQNTLHLKVKQHKLHKIRNGQVIYEICYTIRICVIDEKIRGLHFVQNFVLVSIFLK